MRKYRRLSSMLSFPSNQDLSAQPADAAWHHRDRALICYSVALCTIGSAPSYNCSRCQNYCLAVSAWIVFARPEPTRRARGRRTSKNLVRTQLEAFECLLLDTVELFRVGCLQFSQFIFELLAEALSNDQLNPPIARAPLRRTVTFQRFGVRPSGTPQTESGSGGRRPSVHARY